ncbi:hypothetical protein DV737_g3133, partial [Chaetothyriales sp. CBS 132003]
MPTISVDKEALFKALGRSYTTEEFDELCFDFGIELDEDTTHSDRPVVNGVQERPQLKIEIPANRYDMLCFEGIQLMLNIFNQRVKPPCYTLKPPASGHLETITVSPETAQIRPYVSGAILRNITFDEARYEHFIDLQDKLHQNLARQRTLVSVGTHDLDSIKGPFTYEALPPKDIKFIPLNQTQELDGEQLMHFYDKDRHLGRYLHIIRDSPVYPVVYDARRTPFTVEPIRIVSEHNGQTRVVPDLSPRTTQAEVDYIQACTGVDLSAQQICDLLARMSLTARPSKSDDNLVDVDIPPTRADILHQADVMEDVCIAYGFNRLPRAFPKVGVTIAQPLAVNKLADIVRSEAAMAGWTEVMPLILCSHDENFAWLNRKDDGQTAVRLANPKTAEYQVVRTTLLPGLLKTMRENKHHALPIKVFDVSDVAFKAPELERKSRNERHFGAAYSGKTSGFEIVHGLLDRVMLVLRAAFVTQHDGGVDGGQDGPKSMQYWIQELDDATFFPGHAASIHVLIAGKEHKIGVFGILHPTVLEKFDLKYPVSTLEIDLEVFL